MSDPRFVNAREFLADSWGRVIGVMLTVIPVTGARYEVDQVRLIDEVEAAGRHVVQVEVLDRDGMRVCGHRAILVWPWHPCDMDLVEGLDQVRWPLARCSPYELPLDHMYDPSMDRQGPVAVQVVDEDGRRISDVVAGLGLPSGRHVSYDIVYRERNHDDAPGHTGHAGRDLAGLSDQEIDRIAARAAGEAQVLGYAGVMMVARTILNRLASPDYPDDLGQVLRAYYAPDVPQVLPWHRAAVQAAIQDDTMPRDLVYALSRDDLRTLGVHPDQADMALEQGPWGLYLFRNWPRN